MFWSVYLPPPSYSNSLTSLLPNLYPPLWFPMGLQLIQLSEHTNAICLKMFFFFLNWARNNGAAASRTDTCCRNFCKKVWDKKRKLVAQQGNHFHRSRWREASGHVAASKNEKPREKKVVKSEWEEVERREKWWKGGRSSESPSEVVPCSISSLFSLQ